MQDEARVAQTPDLNQPSGIAYLSRRDVDRLTNYKWRYSLESYGFSTEQAARLLFVKWLVREGVLRG